MYLFVGLGNPGDKYTFNRHNVGFMAIDKVVRGQTTQNISKPQFNSELLKIGDIIYQKPHTYMNLSGNAVASVVGYYKIPIENIVVIHDDIDLEFGALRYKIGGGHGGHNGLKSLDDAIGKEYKRIRIGVGKPADKSEVAHYVLSDFSKVEFEKLDSVLSTVINASKMILHEPLSTVSGLYTLKGAV